MTQDPNPTDLPEVEKFIDWLYEAKYISDNFSAEQLREAMMIGVACATSRDGSAGSELNRIIEMAKRELRADNQSNVQIIRKIFGHYVT